MKIALAGLGTCAEYWTNAARHCDVEIVAVCDKNPQILDKSEAKYRFLTVEGLVSARSKFDVAAVLTPPATHFDAVMRLLDAGVATIVEKPIAPTFGAVESMFARAKERGVFFDCAYHAANAEDVNYFLQNREQLEADLGDLMEFECEFCDPYVQDGVLLQKAAALGGSYLDSCVNALSVVQRLLGLDGLVATNFSPDLLNGDNRQSLVFYKNNRINGTIRTSWLDNRNYKCTTLRYQKGNIVLLHTAQQIIIEKPCHESLTLDCGKGRERLLNHYVNVLNSLSARYTANTNTAPDSLCLHSLLLQNTDHY